MLYIIAGLCGTLGGLCTAVLITTYRLLTTTHAQAAAERNAAHAAMDRERALWATERGDLLQRIQAPEQAIVQHALNAPIPPSPPTVPVDDDEAYWESRLTKEQLAERAYQQELAEA